MKQESFLRIWQPVNKFPEFYGAWRGITAFTSAHHLSLSWARSIQSMPPSHSLKLHFNITLPSTPESFKGSYSRRSPYKIPVYTSSAPIRATCLVHLILLDLISRILFVEVERSYRSYSLSLCSLIESFIAWCCIIWYILTDISEEYPASMFRTKTEDVDCSWRRNFGGSRWV